MIKTTTRIHKKIIKNLIPGLVTILSLSPTLSYASIVVISQKHSLIKHLSALDCKKIYMDMPFNNNYLAKLHGVDLPISSNTRNIFYETLWSMSAKQSYYMRTHIGSNLTLSNQNNAARLVSKSPYLIAYINTDQINLKNFPKTKIISIISNKAIPRDIPLVQQIPQKKQLKQPTQENTASIPKNTIVFPVTFDPKKFTPLDDIARTYNVSKTDIEKWNHLDPRLSLRPGETLTLYIPIKQISQTTSPKSPTTKSQDADTLFELIEDTFAKENSSKN